MNYEGSGGRGSDEGPTGLGWLQREQPLRLAGEHDLRELEAVFLIGGIVKVDRPGDLALALSKIEDPRSRRAGKPRRLIFAHPAAARIIAIEARELAARSSVPSLRS